MSPHDTSQIDGASSKPSVTLKRLLALFGLLIVLLLVAVGWLASGQLNRLKIGGALYASILESKDFVADLEPPPLFLIEAYQEAHEVHQNPETLVEAKKTLGELLSAHRKSKTTWMASGLPQEIKNFVETKTYSAEFWGIVNDELLTSLASNNKAAADLAIDRLIKIFGLHKAAVLNAVNQAHQYHKLKEAEADEAAQALLKTVVALSGFMAALFAAIYYALHTQLVSPLLSLGRVMTRLSGGDLTAEAPSFLRIVELHRMARCVHVFRQSGIDKVRLEGEAAVAREEIEKERAGREAEALAKAQELEFAITALGQGLDQVAQGILSCEIDTPFAAETEKLRFDFNSAVGKLRATISDVTTSARAISAGTGEISIASDDLSRRTEQQAASLEETAAALSEVTATVKKTAAGATNAREIVATTKSDAEHGGVVVQHAVEAMGKIESSSQQISQIIGVIDEIAFQTNLLALNAGVEAARAGDAGRGFAVVASEVRALAQRSADAAKQIKSLIFASSSEVKEGVKLVAQSGEALLRIVTKITAINDVVAEIASGAQDQATGLEQVNVAVGELDQVTQQNAAMAEEATAASRSLEQEGRNLSELMEQFEIVDRGGGQLRSELKKVVPHAFARNSTVPITRGHGGPAKGIAAKPAYGMERVATGRSAAAAAWTDF